MRNSPLSVRLAQGAFNRLPPSNIIPTIVWRGPPFLPPDCPVAKVDGIQVSIASAEDSRPRRVWSRGRIVRGDGVRR